MSRLNELVAELCSDGMEYKALVDVADVLYGAAFRSVLFNDEGNGLPVIRIRDVLRGYSETYYSGDYEQRYVIEDGDMLLGMDGNFNLQSWHGGKALLNQRVCRIASKNEQAVLNRFLQYWLQPVFKSYEEDISRTTVAHMSARIINRIRIPVPPVEVQHEVVRILDEYMAAHDELVCRYANERELLEAQKVVLCNELICRDRYKRKAIGSLGTLTRGKRFTAADYVVGGIPSIHYGEVYTEYGVSSTETVSHLREDMRDSLRFAESGDVIIACTGENRDDICKPVAWMGEGKVAVHDDCHIFHHSMNPRYVAYALLTTEFHDQKVRAATESKVVRVSGKKLASMTIPVPSIERQCEIADTLDQAFSLTEQLISELTTEMELLEIEAQELRTQLLTFPEKIA